MNKKIIIITTILSFFFFFTGNVKAETIKIGNYNATIYEGDTIKISSDEGELIIPDLSNKYTDYVVDKGVSESGYTVYWYNYEDTKSFYVSSLISNRIRTLEFSGSHRGYMLYWPDYNAYYGYVGNDDSGTRTLVTGDSNYSYFVASSQDIYYNGSVYYAKNSEVIPETPTIDIDIYEIGYTDETKKEKLFERIRVTYSKFDTTNYTYKWKSSLNDDEWNEIDENLYYYSDGTEGFLYDNMLNQTLYFVVENKEGKVLSSFTYVANNIVEKLPHVIFNEETPDFCKIDENTYACKGVKAKVAYYNELKYQAFISYDNVIWQDLYLRPEDDYKFFELFTHNTNIHIKFVDRTTGQTLNVFSYNCKGIATEYDISTPNVKYEAKYDKETSKILLTVVIYAYDETLYNYYFSTDNGQTFNEVIELSKLANDIRKKNYYFDYDTTVILKITDKEGNFINSFPYKIEFTKISGEANKETNFLTNIVDIVLNKFSIFEQAYNIYNLYLNYDFEDNKPNIPKINLSFLGIEKEYEIFDFTFYDKYREMIFNYTKLSLALYTLFKLYKIVKGYFGGGK